MAGEGRRRRVVRRLMVAVLIALGVVIVAAVVMPVYKASQGPIVDSLSGGVGETGVSPPDPGALLDTARRPEATAMSERAGTAPAVPGSAAERAGAWLTTASAAAAAPAEPMLIYAASMGLRVRECEKAEAEVRRLTAEHGGFVSAGQIHRGEKRTYATMTVRVPADHLQTLMDEVGKLGKVESEQLETQEVTEEYVDLEARLRNDTREEEQLLRLLERAGKVSDLLQVERALADVRGRIEQTTGRLRYLSNRVALATLAIVIQEESGATAPIAAWSPLGVGKRAVAGLLATLRVAGSALIWVVVFAPIWLAIVIVWRVTRRRGARVSPSA